MYHDVLREVCSKYGKIYSKELQSRMIGGTDRAICEYVVKELKINESVEKFEQHLFEVSEKRLPQAPLQKGVDRLIKHLVVNQVPMALATNSTSHQVQLHAKTKPEIFSVFRHTVTATDPEVRRSKPHPDPFLLAAARFVEKPEPAKCLVFEDSLVGLRAGVAAGMQVVLTPHSRRLKPEEAQEATLVLDSLLEFRPELFGLPPFDDSKPMKPAGSSSACCMYCCKPSTPEDHNKICKGLSNKGAPSLKHDPPPCTTPCYPPKPSPCIPPTLKPSSCLCKPKGRPPWHSLVMFMLLCGITYMTLDRLW